MKKIIAIVLCALLTLPLAACAGNGKPVEPVAEPTAYPYGKPLTYVFNKETLDYSDEYIVMKLPEGFDEIDDMTAPPAASFNSSYIRYVNFKNTALQGSAVNYAVTKAESGENLSEMTPKDLETMCEAVFKQLSQAETEIKTVSFGKTAIGSFPAVLYEYDVTMMGVTMHQLVKLIQKNDNLITVSYTYTADNGDIYRESAASVNLADSGEI